MKGEIIIFVVLTLQNEIENNDMKNNVRNSLESKLPLSLLKRLNPFECIALHF